MAVQVYFPEDSTYLNHVNEVSKHWKNINILSLLKSKSGTAYNCMDGPPFKNGEPHIGHLAVGSAIKDTNNKFQTMNGFKCNYKPGWDCIAEGTIIDLENSSEPIENLKYFIGKKVKTLNDDNCLTYEKITHFLDKGIRDCVELKFLCGYAITCTPDHQIKTCSGWVSAKDLTKDHEVLTTFNETIELFIDNNESISFNDLYKMYTTTIVSITNVGPKHVYDITVENTHNFSANEIVVHNCHGLPIENKSSHDLGLKTKSDIEKYGIDKFNKYCEDLEDSYSGTWESIYEKTGRFMDFKNAYETKNINYMESVWWAFNKLNQKGLVYKGWKVLPYSYGCESPLSNFEAKQNYKTIDTTTVYVKFKLASDLDHEKNIYFVAWTTTPWTLTCNMALCVNPNIKYVLCNDMYIVAENSVQNLSLGPGPVVKTEFYAYGRDLVGKSYVPIFNYLKNNGKFYQILADNYVKDNTDGFGTGIVHLAAAFGKDDCRICLDNNIIDNKTLNDVCPVNSLGQFTDVVSDYKNILVFETDKLIIAHLKNTKLLIKKQIHSHEYPYCYRTNTPLIYKTSSSFFVEVTKIKDRLIEINRTINWSKEEIGKLKFENWLKDAEDWGVSRDRFFGTPIPAWVSDDGEEFITVGSIDELVKIAGLNEHQIPTNLHKEHIEHIIITLPITGKTLKLDGAVFDCWFDSGCVPYGQLHYPFENSTYFDGKEYLSDFVAEGLDQTRGWFYTLLVLSVALLDKAPFKNVICTGMILDEDGKKISKMLGNYIDPSILIKKYGPDVIRMYFLKSPLVNAEPVLFNEKEVYELFQKIIPLINGFKFFVEHYNNFVFVNGDICLEYYDNPITEKLNMMDMWILEKITLLRNNVVKYMNLYQLNVPTKELLDFIEDLTNWYIKLNRDRLKGLHGTEQQLVSLSTLFTVLYDYVLLIAPFMPFLSEHLYLSLHVIIDVVNLKKVNSVHLHDYPKDNKFRLYNMSTSFDKLKHVVKIIRTIRDSSSTHSSVKIPIKECTIYHHDDTYLNEIKTLTDLIVDEVNCLTFNFKVISDDMKKYTIKPNFKLLGSKYKNDCKKITNILENIDQHTLKELFNGNISLNVNIDDKLIEITKDEFTIMVSLSFSTTGSLKFVENNGLIVKADLTYDQHVHDQYEIRKFIIFVQNYRKINKLKPSNRLTLYFDLDSDHPITDYIENLFLEFQPLLNKKLGTNVEKYVKHDYISKEKYLFTNANKEIHNITLYIDYA